MYGKIFDFDNDDPLAGRVSHTAALTYAGFVYYAKPNGVCEQWNMVMGALDLRHEAFLAVVKELEDAGMVDSYTEQVPIGGLGHGGVVMGNVRRIRIIGYEMPERIERLCQSQWAEVRSAVFERDDFTCQYCGKRGGELECDHVIPIAAGGTNEMGNLTTACKGCNRQKRHKIIETWKEEAATQ